MGTHFKAPVEFNAGNASTTPGHASPYAGLPVGIEFLSRFQVFHCDFTTGAELPGAATVSPGVDWTVTETGAGGALSINADGGASFLNMVCDAADNDSQEAQFTASGGGGELYIPTSGKRLYFEAIVGFTDANNDIDTVTEVDAFVGLAVTDTTVIDGATDFIGFVKTDGSVAWRFVAGDAGGASGALIDQYLSGTLKTLTAADTASGRHRLAFLWTGVGNAVLTFVDNVHVGTHVITNYVPDTELCATLCVQNGEAVAKVMTVAKLLIAQEW